MKNYLIVGLVVLLGLAGIWFLAENSEDHAGQQEVQEDEQPTEPEAFNAGVDASELDTYTSPNTALSLSYPQTWSITESPDNNAQEELITLESPVDANGFYFCLDLNGRHGLADVDGFSEFTIEDVSIESINRLNDEIESVIFRIDGVDGLLWGASDSATSESDSSLTNTLAGDNGSSLVQVTGRFNCREIDKPDLSSEIFTNSRLFKEASAIVESLSF